MLSGSYLHTRKLSSVECYEQVLLASASPLVQFTFNVNTLLLPPLVQPISAEFPVGVNTLTLTIPGPAMIPVVSITFRFELLTTAVLSDWLFITTSEAATN